MKNFRSQETVVARADNLSGLIAEYACVAVLKACLDVEISNQKI